MQRTLFHSLAAAAALGSAVCLGGCGGSGANAAAIIPLEQVPPPLLQKAKETLPDVTFDHARKLKNGNIEVRGKTKNGKVREVEMNAAGEIIEIE